MGQFLNELRITVRTLAKARGFTVAATVTLALGIALAASAMAVHMATASQRLTAELAS